MESNRFFISICCAQKAAFFLDSVILNDTIVIRKQISFPKIMQWIQIRLGCKLNTKTKKLNLKWENCNH